VNRAAQWPDRWPPGAEKIIDRETIAAALDRQAERLERRLRRAGEVTLIVLMNGGLYPAVELGKRLDRPLRFDHVHATRYRGAMRGGDIVWGRWPRSVSGSVLLVDDIFDEGHTMQAVVKRLRDDGADEVITAALTVKQHDRGLPRDWLDDGALNVPDRYLFGCGMDWRGYWRQLEEIWAIDG